MKKLIKTLLFLSIIYTSILCVFKAYAIDTNYNKIHVNLNYKIYDRSNFNLINDPVLLKNVSNRIIRILKVLVESHGYQLSVNSISYGEQRNSVIGDFDLNLTMVIYRGVYSRYEDVGETLSYLVSKRCDGDIYHSWSAWNLNRTIEILINDWDDEVLYPSFGKLKKCPFKFKAIKYPN